MKFTATLLAAAAFATSAFAQQVYINSPAANANIPANSTFTVQVVKPNYIQNAPDVSVVIGVASCSQFASGNCPGKSDAIYHPLYNGTYHPVINGGRPTKGRVYQNFTVTLPPTVKKGPAELIGGHFYLVGASYTMALEKFNSSINIV